MPDHPSNSQTAPKATTALGILRGRREGGCDVFRGVPYALPPVGDLRFASPVPSPAWEGERDATTNGPISPQRPSRLDRVMGGFEVPQGEDCLSLTIWTPKADQKRRPVLLWFHGGAYVSGAGNLPWYDGGALAAAGEIVVVGVNYRLGALGYLYREGLIEDGFGQQDQAEALRWVHAHIAAFGGDPQAITVGGQSAGSGSTTMLLLDPSVRPFIRRVILQSGPYGRPAHTPQRATEYADRFMALTGIDPKGPDLLQQLRRLSIDTVLEAQHALMAQTGDLVFQPVARQGQVTGADLIASFADAAAGIEVLVGTTSGEGYAYYGGLPVSDQDAEAAIGDAATVRRLRARFPGANAVTLISEWRSESTFTAGAQALAKAMAARGVRCFAYQFDWHPPQSPFRANHCIELPFMFRNRPLWGDSPMLAGGDAAEIEALSARMSDAWAGFVKTGRPDLGPDLPFWPETSPGRAETLIFGRRISLVSQMI